MASIRPRPKVMTLTEAAAALVAIGIFSAFILYDLKRVRDGEETNYITATLGVYLSLYNIFQSLLALLGIFVVSPLPSAQLFEAAGLTPVVRRRIREAVVASAGPDGWSRVASIGQAVLFRDLHASILKKRAPILGDPNPGQAREKGLRAVRISRAAR